MPEFRGMIRAMIQFKTPGWASARGPQLLHAPKRMQGRALRHRTSHCPFVSGETARVGRSPLESHFTKTASSV